MTPISQTEIKARYYLIQKLEIFNLGSTSDRKATIKALEFILNNDFYDVLRYNKKILNTKSTWTPYQSFYKKNVQHFEFITYMLSPHKYYQISDKYHDKVEGLKDRMRLLVEDYLKKLKGLTRKEGKAIKVLERQVGSVSHLFLPEKPSLELKETKGCLDTTTRAQENSDDFEESTHSLHPCQLVSLIANAFLIGIFAAGFFLSNDQ